MHRPATPSPELSACRQRTVTRMRAPLASPSAGMPQGNKAPPFTFICDGDPGTPPCCACSPWRKALLTSLNRSTSHLTIPPKPAISCSMASHLGRGKLRRWAAWLLVVPPTPGQARANPRCSAVLGLHQHPVPLPRPPRCERELALAAVMGARLAGRLASGVGICCRAWFSLFVVSQQQGVCRHHGRQSCPGRRLLRCQGLPPERRWRRHPCRPGSARPCPSAQLGVAHCPVGILQARRGTCDPVRSIPCENPGCAPCPADIARLMPPCRPPPPHPPPPASSLVR